LEQEIANDGNSDIAPKEVSTQQAESIALGLF
jgi:hypothetical protein